MKFPWAFPLVSSIFVIGGRLPAQQPDTLLYSVPSPPAGAQTGAYLGNSVAIEGGLTVVGAPFDDTIAPDSGVVKIFATATGALLHVLVNPAARAGDNFGWAVAISGTRVVVGAPYYDTAVLDVGAAYVYDLSSATPAVPVITLVHSSQSVGDYFGWSVAISGTRVAIGAPWEITASIRAGSAYVYDLASATPTSAVATLRNPSPAGDDTFGYAVAITGARAVIGAPYDDTAAADSGRAYVYDLAGATPLSPMHTLSKPAPAADENFGFAVAISGARVVVGAPFESFGAEYAGSAYVFDLASVTPITPVVTIRNPLPAALENFATAVAIDGARMVVGTPLDNGGATYAGSAYAYDLASVTPAVPVVAFEKPSRAASDYFGNAVAISGTKVVVGAPNDDTKATDAGSAYVYDLANGAPAVPSVTLSNPGPAVDDGFGFAVAVSGTHVVVGVPFDDTGADNTGRVYVYDFGSATPTIPVFTLPNPSPAAGDRFGWSVAISGPRVVVGAPDDDTRGSDAGSAYVYDLDGALPGTPAVTLSPSGGGNFGRSVSISGTKVVVGSPYSYSGMSSSGSAYVFDLSGAEPTVPQLTLANPSPETGDYFGLSVAISGSRIIVGTPYDNTEAENAGIAYVYNLTGVAPSVPVFTLRNLSPVTDAMYGSSVAVSGMRVVVGVRDGVGGAYVYDLSSAMPTEPLRLNSPSPLPSFFGTAVSVSGTRILVGAYQDFVEAVRVGKAYLYDAASAVPADPVVTMSKPSPTLFDGFGWSVAIDGTTAVVGAPYDDTTATNKGAIYVFGLDAFGPNGGALTLTPPSPLDANASLSVSFSHWTDPSLPLNYTVLVDDIVVSPAGPTDSRNFTGPAAPGQHTLKGRVTDGRGNFTEVTRNIVVLTAQETWRRNYFGITENIGDGADDADPDGDGQNNLFEFVSGLVPTDAKSRFSLRIEDAPRHAIIFSPLVAGRTYIVRSKVALTDSAWTPLSDFSQSDDGPERTVIDLSPGGGSRFYQVEITRP